LITFFFIKTKPKMITPNIERARIYIYIYIYIYRHTHIQGQINNETKCYNV
jgi:hypothetical protein